MDGYVPGTFCYVLFNKGICAFDQVNDVKLEIKFKAFNRCVKFVREI